MANVFQDVAVRKPSSNYFNLSHDVKMSLNMGFLTPFFIMDTLPGDKVNLRSESLLRFSPLIAPVMHDINVFMHYFFVPNRLVWDNFENFMSPPKSDSIPPAAPYFKLGPNMAGYEGTLVDYFGINTTTNLGGDDNTVNVSAIPFAAHNLIYNEYYRDQNLIDEVPFKLTDGDNNVNPVDVYPYLIPRRRAWMHDYFTSSLPFAQKGQAVSLPLIDTQADMRVWRNATEGSAFNWQNTGATQGALVGNVESEDGSIPTNSFYVSGESIQAQATTINDLRRAIKLQEFLEKQARGGSRYIEQIRMHFGVRSSDARLQRPEFLGGFKNPVIISEVLQTSESADTPQATMAGHGISASSGKSINYFCEEHGYIIGLMSVMPKTAYQQGVPRHFSRFDSYDYAWPTFAHIGEQEVLNKEIFLGSDLANNDGTFGYIPRYSEYRYIPSRVAGDFKTTLSFWHLGRIFDTRPALNQTFIECNPSTRIFAVEEGQHLWAHVFNRCKARRNLPKYGTPLL